jgi:hypothetical protein
MQNVPDPSALSPAPTAYPEKTKIRSATLSVPSVPQPTPTQTPVQVLLQKTAHPRILQIHLPQGQGYAHFTVYEGFNTYFAEAAQETWAEDVAEYGETSPAFYASGTSRSMIPSRHCHGWLRRRDLQ